MTEVSQLKNDLAQENLKTEDGIMQINQEQGELMKFMVKIAHAKKESKSVLLLATLAFALPKRSGLTGTCSALM